MKIRRDVVRMYMDVHSWAGILCGLLLFTAFLAGAVTMFEAPLERWLSAPAPVPQTALHDTPALIAKTLKAEPKARKAFSIHLDGEKSPVRMSWMIPKPGAPREHNESGGRHFAAGLDAQGRLQIAEVKKSETAQFIDVLHQQAGLPFAGEISMPIVGIVCLLYVLALVSGVIALLPSLVKDLFALRLGENFKRLWLDVHNVLGLFSLPFHIVMALTSLVFAFHDQFYDAQDAALHGGKMATLWERPKMAVHPGAALLSPAALVERLAVQAPGFEPQRLDYRGAKGRISLMVWGADPRRALRGPTSSPLTVDPYDGKILQADYLPGRQDGWNSAVTGFFALHFGNFGGLAVRWSYVLLGLAGAFLFYTGNLLWVNSRKRKNGGRDTLSTLLLSGLTTGWTLGTMAGVALVIAVAKLAASSLPAAGWQTPLFYAVLVLAVAWSVSQALRKSAGKVVHG